MPNVNRRSFSRRGRPGRREIPQEGLPGWRPLGVALDRETERKKCEADFPIFLKVVFKYPDYDEAFHGTLADFVSGHPNHRRKDKWWKTRGELTRGLRAATGTEITADKCTKDDPYGVPLDGSFRGYFVSWRGSGRKKLILMPRGHLKSSIVTVAFAVWRICRDPRIRILVANATASNSWKFLRAMKWQFLNNKTLKELWPHLDLTPNRILSENITWTKNEFCVPREVEYEAGEATVEGIGVGGNLVSRHYDLIIADDLVNNKNVKTPYLIEQTMEWWQNMHSLLEPGGEVIVIGTRWDYQDLYSTLLYEEEHNQEFSLCIATAVGEDKIPMFPKKFSAAILDGISKDLGDYKFSCQYLNQPVDRERADFQASWFRFYDWPEGNWKNINHYSFCLVDPAFTEDDGDATAVVVFSSDPFHNWYIRRAEAVRRGDIPGLVDAIFGVISDFPDLMCLGIETRGFQRAIAHGLYEEMDRRNVYFAVKELKGESNKNKKWRILRLGPLFRNGKVHFKGRNLATLEGGMKTLSQQILRFPRGADDLADALAYGCDVVVYPDPAEGETRKRHGPERHQDRLRRLSAEKMKKIDEKVKANKNKAELVDSNLGVEG